MWPYHPKLLSTPVPRYTSFPTAAEFREDIGAADLEMALAATTGDVSLYIHIPFCEEICWYCGCNTARANHKHRLASYLEALHLEITRVGRTLPAGTRVTRLAFGGGSPNAIMPTDFVRLMLSLTQAFSLDNPVISVEIDPRTLDAAWATALAGVGVQRASLGVQTFDAAAQAAIGRIQPLHVIERCTALLRGAGVTSLNFDLMYGLPGQDWHALETTLEQTRALGADRVALFGYAHVPHIIARQRRIEEAALPDQAQRFALAALGHDWLVCEGFVPAGFDHFAQPHDPLAKAVLSGRLHRNFQGFTDDSACVLVGRGASAISCFPQLLIQNEKNAGAYAAALTHNILPASRGIRRSVDDRRRGEIIKHLLCRGRARLSPHLSLEVEEGLRAFVSAGLAAVAGDELVIARDGLPYARTIAALFDPYRKTETRKFSSAV